MDTKAALKKWAPTLVPVLLTLVTLASPQVQGWIEHTLTPVFALHPTLAAAVATVVVAIYHALPSPLRK